MFYSLDMTSLKILLVLLLFEATVFVRETEQAPSFISTPPSLLHPVENDNITLQWTYTLDGNTLDKVEITFTPDSPSSSVKRVARYRRGGVTQVATDLQDRFVVNLTNSQSTLTIHRTNRSDTGIHRLEVALDSFSLDPIVHEVKISVKYAAQISYISGNKTLNETNSFNLTCVADGNPDKKEEWTKVSDNKPVSFPLNITGKQDEGGYRCTANNGIGSPDSRIVYVSVQNHHPVNTIMTTNLTDNTVVVNETFSITCSAQASPPAKYRFYEGDEYVNGADTDEVITTSVTERVKMANYSCIPFNFYGNGTKHEIAVTVHYASGGANLTTYPSNTTVLRASNLSLICSADASPEAAFNLSFNGTFVKTSTSGIFNVTVMSDGVYTCVPFNNFSTGKDASVKVTAVDAPLVSISPKAPTVVDGHSSSLTCVASGKPKPSIKWTKFNSSEVLSNDSQLTVNVSRHDAKNNLIQYQCAASNGVGTPATATVSIKVYYPAVNNALNNATVNQTLGPGKAPPCDGEGYPRPTITLTVHYSNGSKKNLSSEGSKLIWKVESPSLFQCTVENDFAIQTVWLFVVLYAENFTVEMTIVNKNCSDEFEEIAQKLEGYVFDILRTSSAIKQTEYLDTFRCGSVTMYVSLIFGQNVEIENIVRVLKKAATEEKFGDLQVDPKSIQAISRERIPKRPTAASAPVDTTMEVHPTEPNCQDSFIPESNCPLSVAFIVFLVVLAVILFSVTFAIIIYCLYKRRKCRKDSRVHSTQSEERPFSPSNENDYSQVNSAYAETGPRSTERANLDHNQGEEGAAAIPTYAVVDKSKKKGRKKDKKAAEMKPTEDQYAAVDKSKKKTKLKNEPDATYAEVDLQKKSKKKPKPGEVLYADLGEFHQMKKMPEVSTSPKALPPIKWPEASAETQYADITQFLKGNSEDPGAELPKESTTPAVSNTATGSKEESSAGNAGDSAEAANETGF